jgi:hypothetical protein
MIAMLVLISACGSSAPASNGTSAQQPRRQHHGK